MRTLRGAALAALAMIGLATTASADPVPTFDFADCPTIPEAADPAQWRCEVLMSNGTVKFGAIAEQPSGAMRLTFAEGQLDGQYAQVFGALRAEPTRVPGGLVGGEDRNPLLRMDIQIEYAGYADFLSVGDQMGEQHLKLRVISPLLPNTCTIGSDEDPIRFKPVRTSGPDVISTNPRVLRFTIEDKTFAVPRAQGCGVLNRLVDKRFGLPAPAGTNAITFTTLVGLKSYQQS
ncbi:hypothetical protein [Actinophytocola sp.]|uniref:hypothetical protein n=1 Tax=Actinophytocola sp. TaxID=1872138 RepID=UPI002ED14445